MSSISMPWSSAPASPACTCCTACAAKGFTARVFEAGKGVGGTWYWNRYPGARCDVESVAVFLPVLARAAAGMGVDRALRHPARDPALRQPRRRPLRPAPRHPVRDAGHQAALRRGGARAGPSRPTRATASIARFVVTAMGCLSSPNTPKIPGLADFKGPTYHTGNWPHEGVDFTGKTRRRDRHRLVGDPVDPDHRPAGQAPDGVPAHRQLHRSRRTTRPLDPDYVREVKANYRDDAQARQDAAGRHRPQRSTWPRRIETPDEERRRQFQERWDYGGLGFMASFTDLLLNDESNKTAADFVRAQDPRDRQGSRRWRRALTPTNVIGCKRLCVDTGYWETFNRPNVTLVDVSERADRAHHADRRARQRPGLHFRLPGAGDRLRRHDRRAAQGSTSAAGTARRSARSGARGRRPISASTVGGLPQPLHHHRAGQPVGADQHAAVDRAARRLDRRLHRIHALAPP